MERRLWTEDELILAMVLLVRVDPATLGGTKYRADGTSTQHPAVVHLAEAIGRTDNAVVSKVQNLRWHLTGGERGLGSTSKLDAEIVSRYEADYDALSERARNLQNEEAARFLAEIL